MDRPQQLDQHDLQEIRTICSRFSYDELNDLIDAIESYLNFKYDNTLFKVIFQNGVLYVTEQPPQKTLEEKIHERFMDYLNHSDTRTPEQKASDLGVTVDYYMMEFGNA